MSDESSFEGLHIDSDWKQEAQREKERLAQETAKQPAANRPTPSNPSGAGFYDILNLVGMQAIVGLGGMQGPGGERIPPNPPLAQYHIDMLEALRTKCQGNLTDEEQTHLDSLLHELRLQYVELIKAITVAQGKLQGQNPAGGPGIASA